MLTVFVAFQFTAWFRCFLPIRDCNAHIEGSVACNIPPENAKSRKQVYHTLSTDAPAILMRLRDRSKTFSMVRHFDNRQDGIRGDFDNHLEKVAVPFCQIFVQNRNHHTLHDKQPEY